MPDSRHDSLGRYIGCYVTDENDLDFSTEAIIFSSVRTIKDFPKKGINFYDVTPLFYHREVLEEIIYALTEQTKRRGIRKVVGLESRGFVLLGALANNINAGAVLARKSGKLPLPGTRITYDKEYGKDSIELPFGAIRHDDVVLIHDDILATGGTAVAAIDLVKKLGVKRILYSCIIEILGEGLSGRKCINAAHPDVEVLSLVKL